MLKSLFPWKHKKTKQMVPEQSPMDEELILQEANLLPCHVCGRTFLPNSLKKHNKVCEKIAIRKRKPFNSLKQRVAGTDLANFHQDNYLKKQDEPTIEKKPKQSKWKEKHLELMTVIRAAKGGAPETMPPTSISSKSRSTTSLHLNNSTPTEQCPSCERYFGPKAYDRHTEWCKEKKARIQPSPSNIQQAKERLEARTKYRVPPLNKSKRAIVREKYSPGSTNVNSTLDTFLKACDSVTNSSPSSLSRGPSIRKPKSLHNLDKFTGGTKEKIQNRSDVERNFIVDHVPNIGSLSQKDDTTKSFLMKKNHIYDKGINDVNVNRQSTGMSVLSVNFAKINSTLVPCKPPIHKHYFNNQSLAGDVGDKKFKKIVNEKFTTIWKKCKTEDNLASDVKESTVKSQSLNDVIEKKWISKIPAKIDCRNRIRKNCQQNETKNTERLKDADDDQKQSEEKLKVSDCHDTCLKLDEWIDSTDNLNNNEIPKDNTDSANLGESIKSLFEDESVNTFYSKDGNIIECHDNVLSNTPSELKNSPVKDQAQRICLFSTSSNDLIDSIRDTSSLNTLTGPMPSFSSVNQNSDYCCSRKKVSVSSLMNSYSDATMENDKNRLDTDLDADFLPKTISEFRSVSSMPALHFSEFHSENSMNENQLVETGRSKQNAETFCCYNFVAKENRMAEMLTLNMCPNVEDYTVPKKKRKICTDADVNHQKVLTKITTDKEQEIIETTKQQIRQICSSSHLSSNLGSATSSTATPRTVQLVNKIAKAKALTWPHGDVLLALSIWDCGKLLDMNKINFEKVEKKLKKKTNKDCSGKMHLPLIVGSIENDLVGSMEMRKKVEFVKLPDINNREMFKGKCMENLSNVPVNYDPFALAQRQFMELLECDESPTIISVTETSRPHTTPVSTKTTTTATTPQLIKKPIKSAEHTKNKRASVIDPPSKFKDSLELVNNDFELIENMFNENFKSTETNSGFYLNNLKNNAESFSLDQIFTNRKYSDDMSTTCIDPCLINENDNLSIPENLTIDNYYSPTLTTADTETTPRGNGDDDKNIDIYSRKYEEKIETIHTTPKITDKKPLVKRSLSLVDRNKLKTSKTRNSIMNNNTKKSTISKSISSSKPQTNNNSTSSSSTRKSNEKIERKKSLPILKRSMTLFNPSPKPTFKNKKDVNDFFNGNNQMSTSLTSDLITEDKIESTINNVNGNLKAEDLFSLDDEMYEEYKKYEEMYLKEKEHQRNRNKISNRQKKNVERNYGLLTTNEETKQSSQTVPNDSAYGSLRKTSNQERIITKYEIKNIENTSSSSSIENGRNSPPDALSKNIPKVSKFCHECGTKFPVQAAKFCVECGVKRLVL